ncbi:hypothetical protein QL285_039436 [Trifolium repens]|nr:hypothetical protein QL285_039436 [Trifolium repens]
MRKSIHRRNDHSSIKEEHAKPQQESNLTNCPSIKTPKLGYAPDWILEHKHKIANRQRTLLRELLQKNQDIQHSMAEREPLILARVIDLLRTSSAKQKRKQ